MVLGGEGEVKQLMVKNRGKTTRAKQPGGGGGGGGGANVF